MDCFCFFPQELDEFEKPLFFFEKKKGATLRSLSVCTILYLFGKEIYGWNLLQCITAHHQEFREGFLKWRVFPEPYLRFFLGCEETSLT